MARAPTSARSLTISSGQKVSEMSDSNKPFPKGCTISNIRQGKGERSCYIYADLRGPDGAWLISATLEYINQRLLECGVEK